MMNWQGSCQNETSVANKAEHGKAKAVVQAKPEDGHSIKTVPCGGCSEYCHWSWEQDAPVPPAGSLDLWMVVIRSFG